MFCDLHKHIEVSFAQNISQVQLKRAKITSQAYYIIIYRYLYLVQNRKRFYQKLTGGCMFGRWYINLSCPDINEKHIAPVLLRVPPV